MLTRRVNVPVLSRALGTNAWVTISNFPCLQPLLLSGQFSDEFQQEVASKQDKKLWVSITGCSSTSEVAASRTISDMLKRGLRNVKIVWIDFELSTLLVPRNLTSKCLVRKRFNPDKCS